MAHVARVNRARRQRPVPFLAGRRGILRPLTPADANRNYLRWINDQDVVEHLETGFFPTTLRSLRQYVASRLGRADCLFLAIVNRKTRRHVGNVKLEPINWIHRTATVGIMIGDKRAWGKGFASETLRLVSDHAFQRLNLRKVSAGTRAVNRGALRAFLNAGFMVEARKRAEMLIDGRPCDVLQLAKFATRNGR